LIEILVNQCYLFRLGDPTRLAVTRVESVDDSDEEEEILPPEIQGIQKFLYNQMNIKLFHDIITY
jgi:hypothetical protein